MNIKRILRNNVSIIVGQTNTGKSMLLADIACQYIKEYTGTIYAYGLKKVILEALPIIPISSVVELETIRNGIILIDEVGQIFDLDNRKQKRLIENTLRQVTHNNNRIIMCGLPTDFKKFLSAKATCFLFKSMTTSDLINGSMAKARLLDYKSEGLGSYVLDLNPNQVLIYEPSERTQYWIDTIRYYERFDTKLGNANLFQKRP